MKECGMDTRHQNRSLVTLCPIELGSVHMTFYFASIFLFSFFLL